MIHPCSEDPHAGAAFLLFGTRYAEDHGEIPWADDQYAPIPYSITNYGMVAMHAPGVFLMDMHGLMRQVEWPFDDAQ